MSLRSVSTILAIIALWVFESRAQSSESMQIYSQSVYDQMNQYVVHESHVRLKASLPIMNSESAFRLSHYFSFFMKDSLGDLSAEGASDRSRYRPGIGLLLEHQRSGLGALIEAGSDESRAVLYHYDMRTSDGSWARLFFESYTDIAMKTTWSGNSIFSNQSKAGWRLALGEKFNLDFFPEFIFQRDKAGWSYANQSEFRYGSRFMYRASLWSLALSVSSPSGCCDANRNYSPFKSTLIFGMDYQL